MLRNSVIAAVTQIGLLFGALIAGAVVVEAIFDWPGIGDYAVQAILTADYKVMLAVTLLVGVDLYRRQHPDRSGARAARPATAGAAVDARPIPAIAGDRTPVLLRLGASRGVSAGAG